MKGNLAGLVEQAYDEGRRLVAPLLGLPGVRLSDTNIKLAQQNASEHFKVVKKIVDTFSPDIALPLMDLSIEANALARYTITPVNDTAVVPKTDFHFDDIARLRKIDLSYDARINSYVDTLRLMKIGLPGHVVRGAYAIGPYSLAAMLMGAEDAAMATITQPQQLHQLCRLAIEVIQDYVGMLVHAKADPIIILEPTGVMLGPRAFEEFSGKYVRHLVESYREVSIIYHICGSSMHLIRQMTESGVAGISLDSCDKGIDMAAVAKETPAELLLIGNINTTTTLHSGTAAEVKAEVRELLGRMAPYPNFILSTACDIPQEAPLENIHALVQAAREYRR